MRTQTTLDELCRRLQENMGDMYSACRAVGVSLQFVNAWRKDDPKVNDAITEACNFGHMGLYSAAVQRAVHGVERPVWYKGEQVGVELEYSDGLLRRLMDVKLPEFQKDAAEQSRITVNVANIMPRADTYEEWLRMRDSTEKQLKAPDPALPAPDTAIDAEFVEIKTSPFEGIEL